MSSIFTLFRKQIETYHKKSQFYSGIKSNWILYNREPVLQAVKKSYTRRSAKCISSFDFSTLYTTIPHNKLIEVLNKIINFVFKGGTRNYIAINKSGSANWVKSIKTFNTIYSKESVTEAIAYLISNCYFRLGDKLFRQDVGIPMGSDPAPAFANLFLFHYESSWLNSMKKTNNILVRKFGQLFRYIDHLLILNNGHSFESYHHDIYPEELQLNKENDNNNSTNILDLHITIQTEFSQLNFLINVTILVSTLPDYHTRTAIFYVECFTLALLLNAFEYVELHLTLLMLHCPLKH